MKLNWKDLTDREQCLIKRNRLQLTLKEVSEEMGVHLSYISKWERGTYKPSTNEVIDKYKKFLNEEMNKMDKENV